MAEHYQESQFISRGNRDLSNENLGALPSLSSKAMFWRPKYLCSSDWLDHLPFAFWLMESIKPKIVVELGAASGAAYFAFCQALDKLNAGGRCYAVDHWSQQNKHAELEKITDYNKTQYEEFSKILDYDLFQAANLFLDGSVDLLHLNLPDPTTDAMLLFQLWQPKLSAQAVVLLHHSQQSSFPHLLQLRTELQKQHQHFEFLQQHGLLVAQFNKPPSDSFSRLLEIRPGEQTYEIVQTVFSRLGKACSAAMQADEAQLQVQQVQMVLADAQSALQQRQQRIDDLLSELTEHKNWLANRDQALSQLHDQLSQTEQQSSSEKNMLNQRISLLENLRTELKQEMENLFAHIEQLNTEKSQLQQQQQQQQRDIARDKESLQQQLRAIELDKELLQQQLRDMELDKQSLQHKLATEAEQAKSVLYQVRQELQHSTDLLTQSQLQVQNLQSDQQQLERQLQVEADERASLSQQLATLTRNAEQQRLQLSQQVQQHQETQLRLEQQLKEQQQLSTHLTGQSEQQLLALAQAEQQIGLRFNELATLTDLYERGQQELQTLRPMAEQVQLLSTQLNVSQDELQVCHAALRENELQLAGSVTALAQKANALAESRSDLTKAQHELQQSYDELAQMGLLLRQQQEIAANAQTQLHAELNQIRKLLELHRKSKSWKLTAPLRAVSSVFGKKDNAARQLRKEQEALTESGLFDENWYLTQYPDLAQAGVDPMLHYLKFGGFEGRRPNPDFDSAFYLAQYPDVVKAGLNPLVHYIKFGRTEQRLTSSNMLEVSL